MHHSLNPPRNHQFIRRVVALALLVCSTAIGPSAHALKTKVKHTVQKGESVASICDHYGVSQRDFLELNGLRKGKHLRLGQEVKIPNVLRVSGKRYKVKPGDTLAGLSMAYYGSERHVPLLVAANPQVTDPSRLRVGAVIKIPPAPNEPS